MSSSADPSALSVLFVTAEFEPVVKVGGLGEAAAGLVAALRRRGSNVEVVLPDYGDLYVSAGTDEVALTVPAWVGIASARRVVAGTTPVTLISLPGLARLHPYRDPSTDAGYADNTRRFLAFSAASAALAELRQPDVIHLNDWHTAAVPAFLGQDIATVLTIHNVAHQGRDDAALLGLLAGNHESYQHGGDLNILAGGIRLASSVVAVSPSYAEEIRHVEHGHGLDGIVRSRSICGIRNGIDVGRWHPLVNPHLPEPFDIDDMSGKEIVQKHLVRHTTLTSDDTPVIGMVARLTHQKGIDLVLDLVRYLPTLDARLVLMGEGDNELVARAARLAGEYSESFHFFARYREPLANVLVAGSDILLAPSRFEPCGLTQMQAMICGTLPVVTNVGGLRDTVTDADVDQERGNGFVARSAGTADVLDAVHRALRAVRSNERRSTLQARGMANDWSWDPSAANYATVYRSAADRVRMVG